MNHKAYLVSITQCLHPCVLQRLCFAPLDEDVNAIPWIEGQYYGEVLDRQMARPRKHRVVAQFL